jgi:hypothetical protein
MERLPNFKDITNEDGKVYGRHVTVTSVNPFNCRFVAKYPDGRILEGRNLFDTGWDEIPNGISALTYILSTGHVINIPKYKAYLPLVEVSDGMDGSRIFHAMNIKCLEDGCVAVWRIILKEVSNSPYKIGDIILSREPLPKQMSKSWKFTS